MESDGISKILNYHLMNYYNYTKATFITGSYAKDDFNSLTSDIDLLMILPDDIKEQKIDKLITTLNGINLPIDCIAIKEKEMNTFPTKTEFIKKPLHNISKRNEIRKDFLLNQKDAFDNGIQIGGNIPKYVIPDIPVNLLKKSINYIFPFLRQRFKNPALSISRIAFLLETNISCSKSSVVTWSKGRIELKYQSLILKDFRSYTTGEKVQLPSDLLAEFEQDTIKKYNIQKNEK